VGATKNNQDNQEFGAIRKTFLILFIYLFFISHESSQLAENSWLSWLFLVAFLFLHMVVYLLK
jgi:hypothetical protein